jgi:uncharacterized membrane protein (DUF2068 family)
MSTLATVDHGWNSKQAQLRVLRAVASVELAKGLLVVFIVIGIVALIRGDASEAAAAVLRFFHVNPDRHFAQMFLDWAGDLTDSKLRKVAIGASAYSLLRFIEGYGLWHAKTWAEWLAIVSGMVYLPLEIHAVIHRQSALHIIVLVVNIAIVAYMIFLRVSARRSKAEHHTILAKH